MTNYEWLVKHDYMPTFIDLIKNHAYGEIISRYGMPKDYIDYISDWLEQERVFKKYVKLEDVFSTIQKSITTYNSTFDGSISDYAMKYLFDAIRKLETKEIDE